MDPFRLVLFVHVAAAVVLIGSSLFAPLTRAAIRRAATLGELRPWLAFARDSARANPVAALVLLTTGLYLAAGRWSEPWLPVATVLFVTSSALAMGVVKPTMMRLDALAAPGADAPVPPAVDAIRWSTTWDLAADALLANDVGAVFLMTYQPGLAGAIATAAACTAGALAARALRRSGRREASSARVTPAG